MDTDRFRYLCSGIIDVVKELRAKKEKISIELVIKSIARTKREEELLMAGSFINFYLNELDKEGRIKLGDCEQ